jgi:hypothetical protein
VCLGYDGLCVCVYVCVCVCVCIVYCILCNKIEIVFYNQYVIAKKKKKNGKIRTQYPKASASLSK